MTQNTNDPYNVNAIGPEFISLRTANAPSFNNSIGKQSSYYRCNLTSSYQYNHHILMNYTPQRPPDFPLTLQISDLYHMLTIEICTIETIERFMKGNRNHDHNLLT